MPDLVAKAVITGDATGLVGAAAQGSGALGGLERAADSAGAAGARMAAGLGAGTAATDAQTKAAVEAASAMAVNDNAMLAEVAHMQQRATASAAVTERLNVLTAAQSEYSNITAKAVAAEKAGIITSAERNTIMEAAAAKLAFVKASTDSVTGAMVKELAAAQAIGQGLAVYGGAAKDAAVDTAALEKLLHAMGLQAGIGRETFKELSASMALLDAHPVLTTLTAVAAAVALVVIAENSYEAAQLKVNVAAEAHAATIGRTGEEYQRLAADIANAADVSEISGGKIAASLINANIDPKDFDALAAAAKDYAVVIGTDVPTAADQLAQSLQHPYDFAKQLTEQYGLFDVAQLRAIKDMQDTGRAADAIAPILKALEDRIGGAAEKTAGFAADWAAVSEGISDAYHWLGGIESFGLSLVPPPPPAIEVQKITPRVDQAQRNRDAVEAIALMDKYNTYGVQLRELDRDRAKAANELAQGEITQAQYQETLNGINLKAAQVEKAHRDALLNLNEAAKQHAEQVKSAIEQGGKLVESSALEADWQTRIAAATGGTTLAKQQLNDEYAIEKAVLPQTSALRYADAASAAKLHAEIDAVTDSMKRQLAAQHAVAAAADVRSEIGSLSGTAFGELDIAALKRQYQLAIVAANEWREQHIANLKAGKEYTAQAAADIETVFRDKLSKAFNDAVDSIHAGVASLTFHAGQTGLALMYQQDVQAAEDWKAKTLAQLGTVAGGVQKYGAEVELIFQDKLAKAYDDDLARRTDWAAGVQRAFNAMSKDAADWAKTSEGLVKDFGGEMKSTLEDAALSGKLSIGDLEQFVIKKMFELLYQITGLEGAFNSALKSLFSGLGNVLGSLFGAPVGGAKAAGGPIDAGKVYLVGEEGPELFVSRDAGNIVPAGAFAYHDRNAAAGRYVHPAYDDDAPVGQRMPNFWRGRDGGAMLQPIVIQMPAGSQAAPAPVINLNVQNNHPGAEVKSGGTQANADGSFDLNLIVDQVDQRMADKNLRGRSALVNSMESTHRLARGAAR